MSRRRDGAVIMARGASRRMGSAKGLLACPDGTGETFVARIASGYHQVGISGVVVCTNELVADYTTALGGASGFEVVGAPTGGETGLTVVAGWRALPDDVTHLWAHPVDLPLVLPATLAYLKEELAGQGERVARPTYQQAPGHPVVLPVGVLQRLVRRRLWESAPMRLVLEQGQRNGDLKGSMLVAVLDQGVVADFDQPSDFAGEYEFEHD